MFLRKYTKFDAGWEAIRALSKIVTYAMVISVFFVLCELFTVYYSQIPDGDAPFRLSFYGSSRTFGAGAVDMDLRGTCVDRGRAPGQPQLSKQ